MRLIPVVAVGAAAILALGPGRTEFYASHLGAPPLPYHCPAGHNVARGWEKGTTGTGAPGELTWHGWTEWASCSQSLDASTGG